MDHENGEKPKAGTLEIPISKKGKAMILQNWGIVVPFISGYQDPTIKYPLLTGDVYGHADWKRFPDGKTIYTSYIVGKSGDAILTISGSLYELGEPAPEYLEMYPNPKERLLKSLKEKEE